MRKSIIILLVILGMVSCKNKQSENTPETYNKTTYISGENGGENDDDKPIDKPFKSNEIKTIEIIDKIIEKLNDNYNIHTILKDDVYHIYDYSLSDKFHINIRTKSGVTYLKINNKLIESDEKKKLELFKLVMEKYSGSLSIVLDDLNDKLDNVN